MLEITETLPSNSLKAIAKHLVSVKNNPRETMDKFEEKLKKNYLLGRKQ